MKNYSFLILLRFTHILYMLLFLWFEQLNIIMKISFPSQNTQWFVYIVSCADNSLYTGITTDLARRLAEHNSIKKGARYTRTRRPVQLVYSEMHENRSQASKREYAIKRLTLKQKQNLINEIKI